MPGFMPGIHVFLPSLKQDVDARDKRGHDDREASASEHDGGFHFFF
jgi:hypothetical protein